MSAPGTARRTDLSSGVGAVVQLVAVVAALVLILHIALVLFEANPGNSFVDTVGDWARTLAWFFRDLFDLSDPKLQVVVNYGLAAAVYLALGRVLGRGLGRI